MDIEERRLILDRGFDRALDAVLDAFLTEGFTLNPTGAGNLHRPGQPGHACRYVMLEASLAVAGCEGVQQAPLGCHVSLFELIGSCTLVTIEKPAARYGEPARGPRLTEHLGHAIHSLMRAGTLNAA